MKLQIYLTEAMAADLLTLAQQERRYPRQQAEILLERALEEAIQRHDTESVGVHATPEAETVEVGHAPARTS